MGLEVMIVSFVVISVLGLIGFMACEDYKSKNEAYKTWRKEMEALQDFDYDFNCYKEE